MRRSSPDADLVPGTVVGDYRIDRTIGDGGMGAVYEATQPVIDKKVAIKVLHQHLCQDKSAVGRFIQEARAVNRIGHPSIVDVFGFGTIEDARAFLVMELLVGETLSARMRREQIPLPDACDVAIEVSHALGAAHEAGIIHRDLKPDNVFLVTRNGMHAIKLLDFGIAKLIEEPDQAVRDATAPGIMIGTPRYISPEQALGLTLDGRTDIYSLGVVIFEMVTGRRPFLGSEARELVEKHARLRPPRAAGLCPDVPAELDDLIDAMLEKDPARRPTLARVREVLEACRETAPVVRAGESPARAVESLAPTQPLEAPLPRRRRWWAIGIPVAAAVAVIVYVIATAKGDEPAAAAVATPVAIPTPVAQPRPVPKIEVPETAAPKIEASQSTAASPEVARPAQTRPAHVKPSPVVHAKRPVPQTPAQHRPAQPPPPVAPVDDDGVRSPFAP